MSSIRETAFSQERHDGGLDADAAALSQMWNVLNRSVAEFNLGQRTITLSPCHESRSLTRQVLRTNFLKEESL